MSEPNEIEFEVLTSSPDLDDYDILTTQMLSVAVPYQSTENFRKLIWAAMVTYAFGNKSVDHVIRRYEYLWDQRKDKSFEQDPNILILRETNETIKLVSDRLEKHITSDQLGEICTKAALCRLEATFKAAYGLIRKKYIFETDALTRLILEQIAWAYVAHSAKDDEIPTLSPTRCITSLKAIFPESGQLYGLLSEWAHIDPSIVENYLRFHKGDAPVVRRSRHDSLQSGFHLITLALVYIEVAQLLFSIFKTEEFLALSERMSENKETYDKLLTQQP